MFSLVAEHPIEFPVAPQGDSISMPLQAQQSDSATVSANDELTISGNFTRKIQNIYVDSIRLTPSMWRQGQSSLTITLPPHKAGIAQIQIFNGAAPVLAPIVVTYGAPASLSPTAVDSRPITSCVKQSRIYMPKARTCLPGYLPVRQ